MVVNLPQTKRPAKQSIAIATISSIKNQFRIVVRVVKCQSMARPYNTAMPPRCYCIARLEMRAVPRQSQRGVTHGGNPLLGAREFERDTRGVAAPAPSRCLFESVGRRQHKHALRAGRMLHEEIAAAVHGVRTGRKSASNHQFYVVA